MALPHQYGNQLDICSVPNNSKTFAKSFYDWDEVQTVAVSHVVGSTISIICCLVVLLLTSKFPTTRRFPSNMLLWKTGCDLAASLIADVKLLSIASVV